MKHSILDRYEALAAEGRLEPDEAQRHVARKLDDVAVQFINAQLASKSSALGWLFSKKSRPAAVPGLYIWGSVGRGKTMLMDLFFDSVGFSRKRRAHFHAFMADVHERIFQWRQAAKRGENRGDDPIAAVAGALASEATLLCFDEFAVTNIADAMILGRLFEALVANGVTVVATSNVEPDNLYKDGLNRALFLPFISMISRHMSVVRLDSRTDYRLEKLAGANVYHSPLGPAANAELQRIFDQMTAGFPVREVDIETKGRRIRVPKAGNGVAWFEFADLCDKPLGASDYLLIARAYHTVILADVPVMRQENHNEAKRFINLIDVFYDNGVKTVISAEAPVQDLYKGTRGTEVFEFDRTVSRLIEMRSEDYLGRSHGADAKSVSGDATGLVET